MNTQPHMKVCIQMYPLLNSTCMCMVPIWISETCYWFSSILIPGPLSWIKAHHNRPWSQLLNQYHLTNSITEISYSLSVPTFEPELTPEPKSVHHDAWTQQQHANMIITTGLTSNRIHRMEGHHLSTTNMICKYIQWYIIIQLYTYFKYHLSHHKILSKQFITLLVNL